MKRKTSAGIILLVMILASGLSNERGERQDMYISIDDLMQLNTVVGSWRSPSPKWSPNGSKIIFASILNNGGLVAVRPEGGFPIRLPIAANDPRYSPDGKWIAYISSKSGSPEIWLWSVEEGRHLQITNLGARISALNWSPDGHWIAFSCDRYGNNDVWKASIPANEVHRLTSDKRFEGFPSWTPDSKKILYVRMDERWIDHDIMEISPDGRNPRLIVSDRDFFDYGAGADFGYPRVSPDGTTVLFRSYRSGWINYWTVPNAGGMEPKQIAPENADQNDARWSPDGRFIAYTSNHNGTHDLCVVAATGGKPRVLMGPKMGVCADPEWSPDGTQISFTLTTPTSPKDLFIVSLKNGEIRQLTSSLPAGNSKERLVSPEKVVYPSSDNLTINAYLYKPRAIRAEEKFPGIIWIHGGPTAQFEEMFQHQNQSSAPNLHFFVQNGYVILQPNIRGSSGYGKPFEDANNKCWGECDLKDVLAGAQYLKSLHYVDPDRLGVMGRSYGSNLTMATVTNAPGVFQAAIAESGYCDWVNKDSLSGVKMYDYELGNLNEHRELRWKLSPLSHVENVTTPIFIMHGEGRPPITPDSKLFVEQLRKYNKVYRYKTYPNERYYVDGLANQRQQMLDKLDFLDRFLKNKPPSQ